MSRLNVYRDNSLVSEHVLMKATVGIGRHPENDIVLDDRTLSRFHARVERRGASYVVIDLNAPNGVYLNGVRITVESDLTPGDRVGLGCYVAIFDESAAKGRKRGDRGGRATAVDDLDVDLDMEVDLDDDDLVSATDVPEVTDAGSSEPELEVDDSLDVDISLSEESEAIVESFDEPVRTAASVEGKSAVYEPTLVLVFNGMEVSRHDVDGEMLVGRSKQCDVVISLLGLSRRHAKIIRTGKTVTVEDLGSQNGTWINNERIEGQATLKHGDLLNFYEYGLLYLEDPHVEISFPGTGFDTAPADPDEILEIQETGRMGPPSGAGPAAQELKLPQPTARSPVPIVDSELDSAPESVESGVAALFEDAGSFLGDEFDDEDDPFASSKDEDPFAVSAEDDDEDLFADADADPGEPAEATNIVNDISSDLSSEDDGADEIDDALRQELESFVDNSTEVADSREETFEKTSATVIPGFGSSGLWPTDGELEDALIQLAEDRMMSLEVYLDGKLVQKYRQMSLYVVELDIGLHPMVSVGTPGARGSVTVTWMPPGKTTLEPIPLGLLFHKPPMP